MGQTSSAPFAPYNAPTSALPSTGTPYKPPASTVEAAFSPAAMTQMGQLYGQPGMGEALKSATLQTPYWQSIVNPPSQTPQPTGLPGNISPDVIQQILRSIGIA